MENTFSQLEVELKKLEIENMKLQNELLSCKIREIKRNTGENIAFSRATP